jgi:hypothetical protein
MRRWRRRRPQHACAAAAGPDADAKADSDTDTHADTEADTHPCSDSGAHACPHSGTNTGADPHAIGDVAIFGSDAAERHHWL